MNAIGISPELTNQLLGNGLLPSSGINGWIIVRSTVMIKIMAKTVSHFFFVINSNMSITLFCSDL